MDGHFQNKAHAHEQTIESWMLTTIQDGGVARHDDLHIDRIDDEWKSPDLWISAALQAHDLAVKIRNRGKFRFSVVIGFSLKNSKGPKGIDFSTKEQFKARFNQTPPSLYLFQPGTEPWTQVKLTKIGDSAQQLVVQRLDSRKLGISGALKDCWYLEFKDANVEGYCRSVLVTECAQEPTE